MRTQEEVVLRKGRAQTLELPSQQGETWPPTGLRLILLPLLMPVPILDLVPRGCPPLSTPHPQGNESDPRPAHPGSVVGRRRLFGWADQSEAAVFPRLSTTGPVGVLRKYFCSVPVWASSSRVTRLIMTGPGGHIDGGCRPTAGSGTWIQSFPVAGVVCAKVWSGGICSAQEFRRLVRPVPTDVARTGYSRRPARRVSKKLRTGFTSVKLATAFLSFFSNLAARPDRSKASPAGDAPKSLEVRFDASPRQSGPDLDLKVLDPA